MSDLVFWSRKIGVTSTHPRAREQAIKRKFLTKRRKFVIVSLLLSLSLYGVQRLSVDNRYPAIVGLSVLAYVLSGWSLIKDLKGVAWLTNLILPVMYPVSVALFYFLLPQSIVTRFVVIAVFGISMYGLMLTANIFAVAATRTIQLLRAGRTVGFLLSVLTSAFLFHVIFSFNLPYYVVGMSAFLVSFLIFLSGIWSYSLTTTKIERDVWLPVLIGSTLVTQGAVTLCFFLIDAPLASIVLSMMMYVLLGIFQHNQEKRLFARTTQEYLGFALIVLIVAIYATLVRWMS